MRIFSLVFGVILLILGIVLLSLYATNLQYSSTPVVGGFLGNELTNFLVVGLAFTILGIGFTAFGALTTPPTKLTIKDVERLGLTGHTIKEAATGTSSLEQAQPAEKRASVQSSRSTRNTSPLKVSGLSKAILSSLPRGKTIEDIVNDTGVDKSVVEQKVLELKSKGFLLESGKLTQKGFEALQSGN